MYALMPQTCKRRPVLCFVVWQNSKYGQLQNFWMYQKYCVKIVSKISQNTRSDLNFNQKYDYGMQGLTLDHSIQSLKHSKKLDSLERNGFARNSSKT